MLDKRQMVLRVDRENLNEILTVLGTLCGGLPEPKEWAKWVEKGQPGPNRDSSIYGEIFKGINLSSADWKIREVWEPTLQAVTQGLFPKLYSGESAKWTMDEDANIAVQSDENERFFVFPLIPSKQDYYIFSFFYSVQKTCLVLQELRTSNVLVDVDFYTDISSFSNSTAQWLTIDEALEL